MCAGQFAIRTQPRGAYSNHSKERSGCSRIATKTPLWLSGRGVARRLHEATCRLSIIPSANSHAFRVDYGISGHFAPATPIPMVALTLLQIHAGKNFLFSHKPISGTPTAHLSSGPPNHFDGGLLSASTGAQVKLSCAHVACLFSGRNLSYRCGRSC